MKRLNSEQRKAIETLQEAHGAVLAMINHLKEDAPPWVEQNAKKIVDASAEACKSIAGILEEEEAADDSCHLMQVLQTPASVLVSGEELLAAIFPNPSIRPTLRWLRRQQEKRILPYVKIGKLVAWDIEEVRRAISEKMTVRTADL